MRVIAFLGACLLFLLAFLQGEADSRGWFTIEEVKIENDPQYLTELEINKAYSELIGMNLLFSPLSDILTVTNQLAWIHSTKVRKIWPNKLSVTIKEHTPLAYWRSNQLITAQGKVISPRSSITLDLPKLVGPVGSSVQVLEQFRLVSQVLALSDLHIETLELENRGSWNIRFSNELVVKLGRDEILERLQRFIAVYKSDLSGRIKDVSSVDARYSHGVAVTWKTKSE